MVVYLLHFETKLAHAQHYLGSTDDLDSRLECHRKGTGARLMEVITEQGIGWCVVRTWPGGRKRERELKRYKNSRELCPLCDSQAANHKPANAIILTSNGFPAPIRALITACGRHPRR